MSEGQGIKGERRTDRRDTTLDPEKLSSQTEKGIAIVEGKGDIGVLRKNIHSLTPDKMRDMNLWRPEEGLEVLKRMSEGKSVIIKGRAGSGKGAVLTGVRHVLRYYGIPHTFLDGHFQDSTDDQLIQSVQRQQVSDVQTGGVVLVDSFDYFYGGKRKIRTMSREKFAPRTARLFENLATVPCVVGTIHEESWQKYLGDPELLDEFRSLTAGYDTYDLPDAFGSRESAEAFLKSNHLTEKEVELIMNIENNPRAMELFLGRFPNKLDQSSQYAWNQFCDLMRHYATLKLIKRDVFDEHKELREKLRSGLVSGNLDDFYIELFDYVYRKDLRLTAHPLVAHK